MYKMLSIKHFMEVCRVVLFLKFTIPHKKRGAAHKEKQLLGTRGDTPPAGNEEAALRPIPQRL